ncbi:MAG: methyltransferase [Rhodococcus sp.]|nr:methyltransferase [Rhodococcus sp. (in: high G+C Gram-positive bacteria)]
MDAINQLFERLRRRPDIEAPNLYAVDAADRLILDEAQAALTDAASGAVTVIGDHYGALTLGAIAGFGASEIRVHQDPVTGERALDLNAREVLTGDVLAASAPPWRSMALSPELVDGARVVLMQIPRSLSELTEIAELIAAHADPEVQVFAGGRDKHMTRAMNDVLAQSFGRVQASLGRQKARVLLASGPQTPAGSLGGPSFPVTEHLAEIDLTVVAHGAVFAGPSLDIGTRFLLENFPQPRPEERTAVDLGCGTGILAATLARRFPQLKVIATDQSAAAVASAAATAEANGVGERVRVLRDDALSTLADDSVDLIVCNPPFHVGAAVHTGAALRMFDAAGRVLRPGGRLWTVYNSHLGYRPALTRLVGPTRQVARNAKFTVTESIVDGHD